jgi:hypothetical protein
MSSAPTKPLIRSYERISFVFIFILATLCGHLLANGILSLSIFDTLSEPTSRIPYALASGSLLGGLVGAFQWLVLRKYVPDKMWIVATWLGTILISLLSAFMNVARQALVPNPFTNLTVPPPSGTTMALLMIASLITSLAGLYLSGYLQLRVLRSYTVNGKWWSFWPIIAGGLRSLHASPVIFFGMIMSNFQAATIASWFSSRLLHMLLPAATQAIAFCYLNRKPPTLDETTIDTPTAPWQQSPELGSYWRSLALSAPLYRKLTRSWKSDLTIEQSLSYQIGVNAQGEIMGYEPNSPVALEYVDQTPLLDLVSNLPTDTAMPLARFNATFAPPAAIYLTPLRQISRRRLIITTYLIITIAGLVSVVVFQLLPTKFGDLFLQLFNY